MELRIQFLRYAVVGLLSNLALYVLYLLATAAGMGAKTAMSILYVTGVVATFTFNRSWSFRHQGKVPASLLKYVLIYLLGYVINWTILFLLVDRAGLAHQWVQGTMIFTLAIGLFLAQKYWVFKQQVSQ